MGAARASWPGRTTRERKVSFDATLREEGSFCDAAVGPGRASADYPRNASRCLGLRGGNVRNADRWEGPIAALQQKAR